MTAEARTVLQGAGLDGPAFVILHAGPRGAMTARARG